MQDNALAKLLLILLAFLIFLLMVLCIVYIVLKYKNRSKAMIKKGKKNKHDVNKKEKNDKKDYNKDSIFDFMEFDNIYDNMIVQQNGKRFLMVIECQGINFDLMSGLEKNSVEQGFIQFLNSLRNPIQIYVQTRTVNLGKSISNYKSKVDEIARAYSAKQLEYNQKLNSGRYSYDQLNKDRLELTRQKNLYEYGADIVSNTERMSLNRNILSKHYYVIVPYYSEENPDVHFAKDEIANIAFSELYTKSQSIISSLGVCGISSKILDTTELMELLYVAYNRDESEIVDLKRSINYGYFDLYSTAPDVYEKRMKELDIKIEKEAIKKANETVYNVLEENEKQRKARQKEAELDDLIAQMAKTLIMENKETIGYDVAEQAIEKVDEEIKNKKEEKIQKEEGEEPNEEKKTVRRRKRRTVQ